MMKHIKSFAIEQRVTIISLTISLLISFAVQVRFELSEYLVYNTLLQLAQVATLTIFIHYIIKYILNRKVN